jgi:hypothetical protein
MASMVEICRSISVFTLHQWLELAAIVLIPQIVCYFVGKGACALTIDRDIRRYRQLDAELEKIRGMPD